MTGFAFAYAVMRVCGGQPRKNPGAPTKNSMIIPLVIIAGLLLLALIGGGGWWYYVTNKKSDIEKVGIGDNYTAVVDDLENGLSDDEGHVDDSSSNSRVFSDEQDVVEYLANQTFRSSNGFTIRFDGSGKMYAEGQYAGVISVLSHNSTSAVIRYSGGVCDEGKLSVHIIGDKLQLTDSLDGTVFLQK
ncbi:MAG: hypothetical protein IJT28_09645 [Bacteroidaceae bacterium]|nr:hypothetical protein [Bacteroidaceae bacterium]